MGDTASLLQTDTLSRLYSYEIDQINADGKKIFIPA